MTPRMLATASPDLATHLAVHGPLPDLDARALVDTAHRAGLTGRGGAGFPTATKLTAVAPGGTVVANGAEGEPASLKDRQLLLTAPHLVLDGLQLAARVTGARRAVAYVRADTVDAVRAALRERRDAVGVEVVAAAPGFVAGQETAVLSVLDGGPPLPQFHRLRVTEQGLGGRPTLVQNVETLAQLALLARYGTDRPATRLFTVHEAARARIHELPLDAELRDLLPAGGQHDLQAVLTGGYHGRWLKLPQAQGIRVGDLAGAGVVLPLAAGECGLEVTARIVRHLAGESARQCGPCRFGLPHLAGVMTALAAPPAGGAATDVLTALRRAAGLVEGRGACHHPDGTAGLVRSALLAFEQDVVLHGYGRCLARIAHAYGGAA